MYNKQKPNYSVEELSEIIKQLIVEYKRYDTLEELVDMYRKNNQPALLKPKR